MQPCKSPITVQRRASRVHLCATGHQVMRSAMTGGTAPCTPPSPGTRGRVVQTHRRPNKPRRGLWVWSHCYAESRLSKEQCKEHRRPRRASIQQSTRRAHRLLNSRSRTKDSLPSTLLISAPSSVRCAPATTHSSCSVLEHYPHHRCDVQAADSRELDFMLGHVHPGSSILLRPHIPTTSSSVFSKRILLQHTEYGTCLHV